MIDPWVVVGIMFLALLGLSYGGYYIYQKYNPANKPPGISCEKSGWSCLPSGIGIKETSPDPSLKSPANQELYLAKFVKASGAGPVLCLPMWYCFRYVNAKTGRYSPFSKWTSLPVYSGAEKLPYPPRGSGLVGKQTCSFNQPTIGAMSLDYPFTMNARGEFIVANLHRYVGKTEINGNNEIPPPDPNKTPVVTEIVGYLTPYTGSGGIKYAWADIMNNPCRNNGCSSRCKGC